jgi:hypothetical protein
MLDLAHEESDLVEVALHELLDLFFRLALVDVQSPSDHFKDDVGLFGQICELILLLSTQMPKVLEHYG